MEMASLNLLLILFTTFSTNVLSYTEGDGSISTRIYPFTCSASDHIQSCNSYLYHISTGHHIEEIASFYSVNVSEVKPILHGKTQKDYLVSVPCSCKDIDGTQMYLYDTKHQVQPGDTFERVAGEFYSRQALKVEGNMSTIHLVCGCVKKESQEIVTYTVQDHDTLSGIEELLSAYESEIQKYNKNFTENPSFLDVGWVLYVPSEKNGIRAKNQGSDLFHILKIVCSFEDGSANLVLSFKPGKRLKVAIAIGVLSAVCFVFVAASIVFLLMRHRSSRNVGEEVNQSAKKRSSLKQQFFKKEMDGKAKTSSQFYTINASIYEFTCINFFLLQKLLRMIDRLSILWRRSKRLQVTSMTPGRLGKVDTVAFTLPY